MTMIEELKALAEKACNPSSDEERRERGKAKDGWIEHDGGPCPVPLDSKVDLLHRSNVSITTVPALWSEEWGRWAWKGTRYEGWNENIIAYRPEQPQ